MHYYTLRMKTTRVKQEEKADTRTIKKSKKYGKMERGHEGEKLRTSANNTPYVNWTLLK